MKPINGAAKSWVRRLAGVVGLLILTTFQPTLQATEGQAFVEPDFESLTLDGKTFVNVVVMQKTDTDIMLRHDGGLTGLKVRNLDNPTLRRLGYVIEDTKGEAAVIKTERLETLPALIQSKDLGWGVFLTLGGLVGLVIGIYLYTGYVFRLICLKSGTTPGLSVWLPLVQAFPLLRAARMSWAWIIAMISLSVLVAYAGFRMPQHTPALAAVLAFAFACLLVAWSVRICQARGKTPFLAVLLLLPGINYLTLVYLAGSK